MNKKFCDKCEKEIKGKYIARTDSELDTDNSAIGTMTHPSRKYSELCLKCAGVKNE